MCVWTHDLLLIYAQCYIPLRVLELSLIILELEKIHLVSKRKVARSKHKDSRLQKIPILPESHLQRRHQVFVVRKLGTELSNQSKEFVFGFSRIFFEFNPDIV